MVQIAQLLKNKSSHVILLVVFISFYLICYFIPYLFILFCKNNEENSEEPIKGFHKLNALLFTFVCLAVTSFSLVLLIVLLFFTPENTSFSQKLNTAASWIWNEETMHVWIAILISLVLGYSMYTLYFIISPKELKDKLMFPPKLFNDDQEQEMDEEMTEWIPQRTIYKMLFAIVLSIFLFTLSLMSLYSYNSPVTNYLYTALYITAIAVVFVTIEWIYTMPILLPFFVIFAMQKNNHI